MMRWAARLPLSEFETLARLRLAPGVECAEMAPAFWLRGESIDEALERQLRMSPGLERFDLIDGLQLRRPGARLPEGALPDTQWRPLREALKPALSAAMIPGRLEERVNLEIIRSSTELPASGLITTLDAWTRHAIQAPQIRLDRLTFAAAADHRVFIMGEPLPPLGGVRFADHSGVFAPCGFEWAPAVDPEVVRRLFRLAAGDVVLLHGDGAPEVIRSEQIVAASRAAARLTQAELLRDHD